MVAAIGRSVGTRTEGGGSNNSAQIAALQKQLVVMQKQIAKLAAGEKTKATQEQMELLSQMMVMVQAQIAALQAADAKNSQMKAAAAIAEQAGQAGQATKENPLPRKTGGLLDVMV